MNNYYPQPKEVQEMFAKRPYASVGESELLPELMSVLSLFPFIKHCSYMRAQMAGTHITQIQTIGNPELPAILTGMEYEYGKTTTSISSPDVRVRVLRVIHRYNTQGGGTGASITENPESWILYQELDTHRLGVIELPRYYSHHTLFMHKYQPVTQVLQRILNGKDVILEPNTLIYRSPNLTEEGYYSLGGVNLNAVFLSVPGIAEDGVIMSKSAVAKFPYKKKTIVAFEYGYDRLPMNTYGTPEFYKPFPDIGDSIREDGLVCALIKYDPDYAFVQQNVHGLMQPDLNGDVELRYATPGGKVVGVNIICDNTSNVRGLPEGMDRNFSKYIVAELKALRELWQTYNGIRSHNKNVEVTPELNVLLRTAMAKLRASGEQIGFPKANNKESFRYKDERLDQYRVEIIIEHEIIPFEAHKFSNMHASKGVLVGVWPDENMPVDDRGNRAEIILSPQSVPNRKNPSILFELTTNASSRDTAYKIRSMLKPGIAPGVLLTNREANALLDDLEVSDPGLLRQANEYLLGYYRDVAPMLWHDVTKNGTAGRDSAAIREHMHYILTDCDKYMYLKIPTNDPVSGNERAEVILNKYPSFMSPMTYVDAAGNKVRTQTAARVGTVYTFMLEKITTDTYGAQNIGKPQIHGVLSNPGGINRQFLPYRANSTKMTGELEVQMLTHLGSARGIAELSDMSNNPNLFGHMADNIMRAPNPSQMESFIDRSQHAVGQSLLRNRVEHMFGAMGISMEYQKFQQAPKPEGFMEGCGLTSLVNAEPISFDPEIAEAFVKTRYESN